MQNKLFNKIVVGWLISSCLSTAQISWNQNRVSYGLPGENTQAPPNGQYVNSFLPGDYAHLRLGNEVGHGSTGWGSSQTFSYNRSFTDLGFLRNEVDDNPGPRRLFLLSGDNLEMEGLRRIRFANVLTDWTTEGEITIRKPENGWDNNRHSLMRYFSFQNSRDQFTAQGLHSGTKKYIILIHGWNPNGNTKHYGGNFQLLDEEIRNWLQREKVNDWRILQYRWEGDADTGQLNWTNLTSWNTRSGTRSAEIARLHGYNLAESILTEVPDLAKVHLIAHSAGSWAARSALEYLLDHSSAKIQMSLLDAYIPGQVFGQGSVLTMGAMNSIATEFNSREKIFGLDNYFAHTPVATPGTQESFAWGSYALEANNIRVNDYGFSEWDGHSGPIRYYADSVSNAGIGTFDFPGGWGQSIANQEVSEGRLLVPSGQSFASTGSASEEIEVDSNLTWNASSNSSWLQVVSGDSGSGAGILKYRVLENNSPTGRTGVISFTAPRPGMSALSATHTVTQSGVGSELTITPTNRSFQKSAASGTIDVSSNVNWIASRGSYTWITINSNTSGSGNGQINFSLTSNSGDNERTGEIIITGGGFSRTLSITQFGNAGPQLLTLKGSNVSDSLVWGCSLPTAKNIFRADESEIYFNFILENNTPSDSHFQSRFYAKGPNGESSVSDTSENVYVPPGSCQSYYWYQRWHRNWPIGDWTFEVRIREYAPGVGWSSWRSLANHNFQITDQSPRVTFVSAPPATVDPGQVLDVGVKVYRGASYTLSWEAGAFNSGWSGSQTRDYNFGWSGDYEHSNSFVVPLSAAGQTFTMTARATNGTGTDRVEQQITVREVPRVIALEGDLSFGDVSILTGATRQFKIENKGLVDLNVSSVNTNNPLVSVNWTSGAISPGGHQYVGVFYSPNSSDQLSGQIQVVSNATSGNETISFSGAGYMPPNYLNVSETFVNLNYNESNFDIFVSDAIGVSLDYEVQITEGSDWVSFSMPADRSTPDSVEFLASSNTQGEARFATILLISQDAQNSPVYISVTQEPAPDAPLPVLNSHPMNQSVMESNESIFSVDATGTAPLSYQWQLSTNSGSTWSDIPNATSATYDTGPTIVSMNGYQYQCVVSNSAGSVTSNSALLTVTAESSNSYIEWAGGVLPTDDSSGDGVANSMAWVLGSSGPGQNARDLMPEIDISSHLNGKMVFNFRRNRAALDDPDARVDVEYGSDLSGWTEAVHSGDGPNDITITSNADGYGAGIDHVSVAIPRAHAMGGSLFMRLRVQLQDSTGLPALEPIFSENFGNLTNGTPISTTNSALTYVRIGTQGGSIVSKNPSSFGNGSSLIINGPSGGSLNGIGVGSGIMLQSTLHLNLAFDLNLQNTPGQIVIGMGTGNSFTGNGTFNTSQGLFWLQINGTTIQRRSREGTWVNTGVSLSANTPARLGVIVDRIMETMDLYLDEQLVANALPLTSPWIEADAFRVYAVNGSSIELNNIEVSADFLPRHDGAQAVSNKPVKVYILSGQQNMTGFGRIEGDEPGTLNTVTRTENKFSYLIDNFGNFIPRQDVHYRGIISALGNAPLAPGFGINSNSFGPELGFGHVMGWYHDEPVLVIKASIGNRGLLWDLLPPGSDRFNWADGYTYAGFGDSPSKWPTSQPKPDPTGWYAGREFDNWYEHPDDWAPQGDAFTPVTNITTVLDNFATEYPQWSSQGFEIAGFGWFHGYNDISEPAASKYEENMERKIKYLRSYYENRYPGKVAPNAPYAIATLAVGGASQTGGILKVANAQLALDGDAGNYPEFDGNVKTMDARGFWRDFGPSTQGFHYNHNAETYLLVGEALGRAMIQMKSKDNP